MEGLRIRIPQVFHCINEGCLEYVYRPNWSCMECALLSRMRQEMTAATLTRKSKVVHSSPLRSDTSGRR